MSAKDNPVLRHFRNFVIISLLIVLVVAACFYLTGTLVLVTISGKWEIIKAYCKLPIHKQFLYLAKVLDTYWSFYFKNSAKLKL